jgi:U6 snRNA-associated Sm-like protein LSm7
MSGSAGHRERDSALNLAKFIDKKILVKLAGGREVVGILKGYDQLLNLVLDQAEEHMRDGEDPMKLSGDVRNLGLMVCRGIAVMLVSPMDGTEAIENPFVHAAAG